jgi:hypothetical protein
MPPNGYTTVTIPDETAGELGQLMVKHELESMASAIEYATTIALDEQPMSDVELARLLYHRLSTTNRTE